MEEAPFLHISDTEDKAVNHNDNEESEMPRWQGKRRMIIDDSTDDEEEANCVHDDNYVKEDGVAAGFVKNSKQDSCSSKDDEKEKPCTIPRKEAVVSRNRHHEKDFGELDSDIEKLKSSDILDIEESDEDILGEEVTKTRSQTDYNTCVDKRGRSDEDEGFDENQLNPHLLAKLKKLKGARKERTKYHRKSKPSAEKMLEIYSESQRLIRGSRVNLPYYEPETKSLETFLARASKKREEYAGLQHAKDLQKAQIIQDKLAITPPKVRGLSEAMTKYGSKKRCGAIGGTNNLIQSPPSDSGLQKKTNTSQSPVTTCSIKQAINCIQLSSPAKVSSHSEQAEDSQDMPVTQTSTDMKACSTLVMKDGDCQMKDKNCPAEQQVLELETVPSIQKDPSRDLFQSQNTDDGGKKENVLNREQLNVIDCGSKEAETKEIGANSNMLGNIKMIPTSASDDRTLSNTYQTVTAPAHLEDLSFQTPRRFFQRLGKVELPAMPRLSGSSDKLICLDGPESSKKHKDSGLLQLMKQVAEHSRKNTPRPAHNVSINIVQKGESDRKELVLKSLTYHVREDTEVMLNSTQGNKLTLLKQKLDVDMRKKREAARQRRVQLYALENEEGFQEDKSDDSMEEQEAEMTEGSDSSEEENDNEKEDILNFDNFSDVSNEETEYNPLIDVEANEDNSERSSDGENSDVGHLHFDIDDEDGEDRKESDEANEKTEDNEIVVTNLRKMKRAQPIIQSDDDEDNDVIGTSQLVNDKLDRMEDKENFSQWSNEMIGQSSHLQETPAPAQHVYRRENCLSQDLYSTGATEDSQASSQEQLSNPCLSPGYCISQPLYLDHDGFLKPSQTQEPPRSRIVLLAQQPSDSRVKMSAGNIFHGADSQECAGDGGDENMKELVGLCSGTFGPPPWDGGDVSLSSQNNLKGTESFENRGLTSDDTVFDPFHVLSDNEDQDMDKNTNQKHLGESVLSDSEGDENSGSDPDVDQDSPSVPVTFIGFKDKKNRIRKEFLEEEAELSGSEYESDEDLDLAEEEDVLEVEAGDNDLLGVSTEKIRDQVGRLHMKQLQDEDDREVMRFKEMYLQDGDLFSEGGGRLRNFRWKDIDETDLLGQQLDEEELAEEEGEDLQWRKDRYEREKFLEADPNPKDENSQVLMLGQFFLKKKESSIPPAKLIKETVKFLPTTEKSTAPQSHQPRLQKKGSFLSRSKETLAKIAEVAKATFGGHLTKNSRNFVFQTMDQQDTHDDKKEMPKPSHPSKRKAHSAIHSATSAKKVKANSIPVVATPVRRQNSVFNLLQDK